MKIIGANENTNYNEYWIEGSDNSGITRVITFDIPYPTLLCYEVNETILYTNPLYTSYYEDYPTSIKSLQKSSIAKLFPNPTTNLINIKSKTKILGYQMVSCIGQKLIGNSANSTSFFIDLSELSPSIYTFVLKTEKNAFSKKIVKNNSRNLFDIATPHQKHKQKSPSCSETNWGCIFYGCNLQPQ